jgi:TolA-binding protein
MKLRAFAVCWLMAAPILAPGADKQIQELQRDIAILQQSIKDLQKSQDDKLSALLELSRQAIEAANRANTGVAVVNSSLEKSLKDLPEKLSGPVAGLASRINEMAGDIRTLLQSNNDMVTQLTRMQSKLNDIETQVKAVNIPAVAPPGASDAPAGAPAAERPPMPASAMYAAALGDYRSGKYDMALQGFASFLKWYPAEPLAADAHYYTGDYYFKQKDYEKAVAEFDLVKGFEGPTNSKLSSAMLYRGRALALMPGHKTEGATEFIRLIQKFPQSDDAKQACEGLKELGRNCPATAPPGAPAGGASGS